MLLSPSGNEAPCHLTLYPAQGYRAAASPRVLEIWGRGRGHRLGYLGPCNLQPRVNGMLSLARSPEACLDTQDRVTRSCTQTYSTDTLTCTYRIHRSLNAHGHAHTRTHGSERTSTGPPRQLQTHIPRGAVTLTHCRPLSVVQSFPHQTSPLYFPSAFSTPAPGARPPHLGAGRGLGMELLLRLPRALGSAGVSSEPDGRSGRGQILRSGCSRRGLGPGQGRSTVRALGASAATARA